MTAIGFTGPIFIMAGAVVFLGEPMVRARWIAAGIGFLGVLVVGLGVVGVPVVGLGVLGVLVCRPRWRQLQLSSSDSDLAVRLPPAKDVGLVGERKTRGEYRFMKLMK
jgi:hypothetical protein